MEKTEDDISFSRAYIVHNIIIEYTLCDMGVNSLCRKTTTIPQNKHSEKSQPHGLQVIFRVH